MKVDSRNFRKALGCFPTGVAVVATLKPDGAPVGVTVSSFTSVSLEPPLVLFCLDKRNAHLEDFTGGGRFSVNMLREEQREISIRFASRAEQTRFTELDWTRWEDGGVPILNGCLAQLECSLTSTYDEGDHVIVVGQVERLEYSQGGQPLVYWRGTYAQLGSAQIP